ncbi:MAG: HDOD domain-containing protein [bacterium]|nr:HDOD domain-containing protein [bacterium]
MCDNVEIKNLIEKVNSSKISSIKQTLTEVINIINDPDSSAKVLKDVIEKDPPLSAKLLKLSNSAFYSYPKDIRGVQEAIVLIGFSAVKELALSQKVCELFKSDVSINGYSRNGLWKHCNAVAILAKLIYRREFSESGENAFMAGLLHDIGIIVEDQFMQDQFKDCVLGSEDGEEDLYQREQGNFGFDHTQIGAALAKTWRFPDELIISIGGHHDPGEIEKPYRELALTLFVADHVCQSVNLGYCDSLYTSDHTYRKYLKELDINPVGLDLLLDEVNEELYKMEKAGWFKDE